MTWQDVDLVRTLTAIPKELTALPASVFSSGESYSQISNFLKTLATNRKGEYRVFHLKSPQSDSKLFFAGHGVITFMCTGCIF